MTAWAVAYALVLHAVVGLGPLHHGTGHAAAAERCITGVAPAASDQNGQPGHSGIVCDLCLACACMAFVAPELVRSDPGVPRTDRLRWPPLREAGPHRPGLFKEQARAPPLTV